MVHCEDWGRGQKMGRGTVGRVLQFTSEKYRPLDGRECGVGDGKVDRKKGSDSLRVICVGGNVFISLLVCILKIIET